MSESVINDELEMEQPLDDSEATEALSGNGRIYTEQGDPEVDGLLRKFERGRLIIQPDFQRQFVWDEKKASRLVESALLDIPLPVIYLSEEQDGKEHVIDGQQRLTSFFSFIQGKLPSGKEFRLNGLRALSHLNRRSFSELDDQTQDKVRYCKVRTITFKKDSDPDLKFEVFERLNCGSVSLNDQELRNCTHRGPYNELLRRLAQDTDFRFLLGLQKADPRMQDVQLVLRFAAFYHATYINYKPPMRKFLNDDMARFQHISPADALELESRFKNALTCIKSLLGEHAFRRYYRGSSNDRNGRWESKKFNASLYDILMDTMAREDRNTVHRNLEAIREALIFLMTEDQEFIDSIELSTSSTQAVVTRFDRWRGILKDIIGVGQRQARCFTLALKQQLYDADPTCKLCNQRIQHIDDAAVDHIEQYWRGGETIPENARLAHRYCNGARPRND